MSEKKEGEIEIEKIKKIAEDYKDKVEHYQQEVKTIKNIICDENYHRRLSEFLRSIDVSNCSCWIPVNEVLPHEDMQILVTVNGPLNKRLIQIAFYLKENPKDNDFLWDGEGFYIFVHYHYKYMKINVLAWRNMPTVYDR